MPRRVFFVSVDDSCSSTLAETLRSAGFTVLPAPPQLCVAAPSQDLAADATSADASICTVTVVDVAQQCDGSRAPTGSRLAHGEGGSRLSQDADPGTLLSRYARLSERDREVAELVVRGLLNKQISAELGVAERTVKLHRAQAMKKLEVQSVPELVRFMDRIARLTARKSAQSAARSARPSDTQKGA